MCCQQALDIDPQCPAAFMGLLMAELQVKEQEDLKNCTQSFESSENYKALMECGNDYLRGILKGYIDDINSRTNGVAENNINIVANNEVNALANNEVNAFANNEVNAFANANEGDLSNAAADNATAEYEDIYQKAVALMNSAKDEMDFRSAAEAFNYMGAYKDSAVLAQQCIGKAEAIEKEAILFKGKLAMFKQSPEGYREAIAIFNTIPDWRDSAALAETCRKMLGISGNATSDIPPSVSIPRSKEIVNSKEIVQPMNIPQQKEIVPPVDIPQQNETEPPVDIPHVAELKQPKKKSKLLKKIMLIAVPVLCLIIAAVLIITLVVIPDSKYKDAVELMKDEKYEEAIEAFEKLDGYKDSKDKIAECEEELKNARIEENIAALKKCEVGGTVKLGEYTQNGDNDEKTAIEWIVLEKQEDKVLLISKNVLEAKFFSKGSENGATWEVSVLRTWLNHDFKNIAFSIREQNIIAATTVNMEKNAVYRRVIPGNDTEDCLFLLNATQVAKYFPNIEDRKCVPTAYAVSKGVVKDESGNCQWWLNLPGSDLFRAAIIDALGNINYEGVGIDNTTIGVRPAMWVSIK